MKKHITTLVAALALAASGYGQAFTGTYTFDSVTTGSGTIDPTMVPTANGVVFGSFIAVGTPVNPNAGGRFSFTDWSLGATTGSDVFTGGLDMNEYFAVTIAPAAGFTIDLSSIAFTLQRSSTGIRQYAVRSSLDAFTSNLQAIISPANTDLQVVSGNIFQVADITTAAETGSLVSLTASFLDLNSPVTFRFYGFNAETTGGTFSIDNVAISGTAATAIPEPSAYAAIMGALTLGVVLYRRRQKA